MSDFKEMLKNKIESMVYDALEDWIDNIDLTEFISYADIEDALNNKLSSELDIEEIITDMLDEVVEDIDFDI